MHFQVKRELENSLSASPSPANYTSLYDKENYPSRRSQALHNKGAAVTGKLEVRSVEYSTVIAANIVQFKYLDYFNIYCLQNRVQYLTKKLCWYGIIMMVSLSA